MLLFAALIFHDNDGAVVELTDWIPCRTRLDAAESQLPSDIESTTHSSSLRMVDEDESLDKDGTTMGDMVVDQKVSKPAGGGRGWWWRNAFSDFFLGRCHGFLSSVKQSSSRYILSSQSLTTFFLSCFLPALRTFTCFTHKADQVLRICNTCLHSAMSSLLSTIA